MLCTYQHLTDENESDDLYKIQLLQIFGVENIDNITDEIMDGLYDNVSGNKWFMSMCDKSFYNTFGTSIENGERMGFVIMFHYGLFWVTHKCICEIITIGNVKNETMILLENIIQKNE